MLALVTPFGALSAHDASPINWIFCCVQHGTLHAILHFWTGTNWGKVVGWTSRIVSNTGDAADYEIAGGLAVGIVGAVTGGIGAATAEAAATAEEGALATAPGLVGLSDDELAAVWGAGPRGGGMLGGMSMKEAKTLLSRWDKASFPSLRRSILYHAEKHGFRDIALYLRKAANFNKRGAVRTVLEDGAVRWTRKSGEFIIERGGKIVSYGLY
jgi:hypothetical protein